MSNISGFSENKVKVFITNLLYVCYAFVGAYGAVMSFASCFSLEKEKSFFIFPVLFTVVVCVIFCIKKISLLSFIVMLTGIGVFVGIRIKDIVGSFITVANIIIKDINQSYFMGYALFDYPDFVQEYRETDLFLLVAMILITVMICYFVIGNSSVVGCILISLPLTVFGIFFDIFPQRMYLVMSVMFWAVATVLKASGNYGRNKSDVAAINAILVVVVIGIIALVAQKVVPEESYSKEEELKKIKLYINEKIEKLNSTEVGIGDFLGASSGIGDGSFGDKEEVTFSGAKMLEVTVPVIDRNIYIKAKEYNNYIGNGWTNNEVWFRNNFDDLYIDKVYEKWPQNITFTLVDGFANTLAYYGMSFEEYVNITDFYTIKVENVGEEKKAFVPYGALIEESMEDDLIPYKEKDNPAEYKVYGADVGRFISAFSGGLSENYYSEIRNSDMITGDFREILELEKLYATYVRKAYTEVPSDLSDTLQKYVPQTVEYNYRSEIEFAQNVQDMFRRDFNYSLTPGKVPRGEDGVEYFLEETKEGYCVYFATAATLIFREAGIPARYVEGYIVTPDMVSINKVTKQTEYRTNNEGVVAQELEYATVTVPDNKAHAWTEIYIAGYGWIPIEVTPGYAADTIYEAGMQEAEETTEMMSETQKESVDEDKDEVNTEEDKEDLEDEKESGEIIKMLFMLWGLCLFVAGIIFAAKFWYDAGNKKIKGIIYGDKGFPSKKRACLVWWYIERVCDFLGKTIPDNISCEEQKVFLRENIEFFSNSDFNDTIDYIIKAYYGNENLTNDELTKIGEMAADFRKETYDSLSKMQCFVFKYIRRL